MSFDTSSLFASVVIGLVGLSICLHGKEQGRAPQLVAGLAMMVYPYFGPGAAWMIAIAVALVATLWLAEEAPEAGEAHPHRATSEPELGCTRSPRRTRSSRAAAGDVGSLGRSGRCPNRRRTFSIRGRAAMNAWAI